MVAWFDEPIQTIRGMSVGAALAPGFEVSIAKNPMDKTLTNWPSATMNPAFDGKGPMLGKSGSNSMYHITDPATIAASQATATEKNIELEANESALTQKLVQDKLAGERGLGDPRAFAANMFGNPDHPSAPQISAADLGEVEIPGPPSYADYSVTQERGVQQTDVQRPVRYQEPEPSKIAKPDESSAINTGVNLSDVFSIGGYGTPDFKKSLLDDDGSFKYSLNKLLKKKE